MIRPTGSWVAIVTPFTSDGAVDYDGFSTLVDFQVAHGTDGLLVMGSTGEATSLTPAERREIISRVVPMAKGRIPLFVGTTAGTTAETIALSEHAAKADADGLLLIVPPYIQPPQTGIYNHFKAVADAVPLPIALYNNPSRVGVNIDAATVAQLAQLPNIVADKEAMGNVGQLGEVRRLTNPDFHLLCCDAPVYGLILPTLALGGHGTANISGNIIPEEMRALSQPWHTWEDVTRTRELFFKFLPLMSALYSLSNPIAVKAALRLLGLPGGPVRPPLVELAGDKLQNLAHYLETLGVQAKYARPTAHVG
ncbi:MAG: 4-hydroxy-tetrahydrodipicolinate synthase [Chloroflexi bacterium]|nr:4-hydroxy-tetrahydrodipicolinate synthase [Chloroflexota bacterium]